MNNYDAYAEQLSASGLNAVIEPSDTKNGEYLNDDGNVLTIIAIQIISKTQSTT